MEWIKVCSVNDLAEDEPKSAQLNETEVGIYKVDGDYYALENVCPHAYALLTEGFVEEGKVECPLHEAIFDIKTGQLESGPGQRNLCRYAVKVEGDDIYIASIK